MIVMLFEYWLAPEHVEEYRAHAAHLRALAADADGLCSIESFHSTSEPDKLLALGVFRDEAAVRAWRNHPDHRAAQADGRARLFTGYRLRMANVLRDYTHDRRHTAPQDSQQHHIKPEGV